MSQTNWDHELDRVAREIAAVRAAYAKVRLTGNKALIARKVAIIQSQINLQRNLERLKQLVGRDLLLLPRERALQHWVRIYTEHAEKFTALHSRLETRTLWLKLIKTRLLGPGTRGKRVDADDVVTLTIRQKSLTQTETYLTEALKRLNRHRRDLFARYDRLAITAANNDAARSLGSRLGANLNDALSSASMRALGTYVKTAVAVLHAPLTEHHDDLETSLVAKTDSLFTLCRNLVIAKLNDADAPPPRRVDRFDIAMQQLADLEDETRQAYRQMTETPPPPEPILVQKGPKKAKTDDLGISSQII